LCLSAFDLRSAYQIQIVESDCKYTAFEANGELYEFTRIPFGFNNGVAAFERIMSQFVEQENLRDTFPFLDNPHIWIMVTVAGRYQEKHDDNVKSFHAAIRRRKFTLNERRQLFLRKISKFGYVVGNGVVKPDPERMRALTEFPPPTGYMALRRDLGMFAYYAKWIDNFADKVRPLAETKNFPLSGDALNSFKFLKSELANVALRSIDELEPFVVECDASDVGISATLNQRGCPVAFMSRTLQAATFTILLMKKRLPL